MSDIITIRPKVIFSKIENNFPDKNVSFTVNIPTSQLGGLTLLESSILVSFVKLINPTYLFEFGTFMGATSVLLATNTQNSAKVFSLDIDPKELENKELIIDETKLLSDDKENDNFLRNTFVNYGAQYIKNSDKSIQSKIELILQNSLKLDPVEQEFLKKFDFIFIDGGHEYHIVKKDTENALKMLKQNGIILWHDYNSNIHGDVTKFLNEFCINNTIYHVENTMIAFMLIGDYTNLIK
jgi:predicted O-methyltransferase YrrM